MDRFERVVRVIARDEGCGLRMERGLAGMMYVEYGYVEGPTIDPVGTYPNEESCLMVILHELGHFVRGHTQARPPFQDQSHYFDNGVLRSEAEAWEYALDTARELNLVTEFSDETRSFMWDTCLGSYYRGAVRAGGRSGQRLLNGDRGYHAFTYDVPDNYFWGVAERLKSGVYKEALVGA